jgi:S-(hydroxymethyl)glutathione dehydrogenase / alcohol dehydrogenase
MRAAVLTEIDKPLQIRDVQLPEHLEPGQVLVKVLVSGICGSQLHEIRGHKGNAKFLPHLMGHEGCGIVQKVGTGVTTVKVGDKVVMHWRVGAGMEAPFPVYMMDGEKMTSGKVTTLSEYSVVSENRLTTVPQNVSPDICALMGCSMTTALGIIDNEADLKFGESVAIIGAGGLGLNLIQAAKLKGVYPIIVVDTNRLKDDMCFKLGANRFYFEGISVLDHKVDVIIDTTGIPRVINDCVHKLSDNGRLILAGQPAPGDTLSITDALTLFSGQGKTIKATQGGKTRPDVDIPRYVKMYNAGLLSKNGLITNRFDLQNVNAAFDLLRSGTAGRIMIDIGE